MSKKYFEIDQILNKKIKKGKEFFLVKWDGYDNSYNTWEPINNLKNCKKLLDDFNNKFTNISKDEVEDIFINNKNEIKIYENKFLNYFKDYKDELKIKDHIFLNGKIYYIIFYKVNDYFIISKNDFPINFSSLLIDYYENCLKITNNICNYDLNKINN